MLLSFVFGTSESPDGTPATLALRPTYKMWSVGQPTVHSRVVPHTLPLRENPFWPPSSPSTSLRTPHEPSNSTSLRLREPSPRNPAARRSSKTSLPGTGVAFEPDRDWERIALTARPRKVQIKKQDSFDWEDPLDGRFFGGTRGSLDDGSVCSPRTTHGSPEMLKPFLPSVKRQSEAAREAAFEAARSKWRRLGFRLGCAKQATTATEPIDTFSTGTKANALHRVRGPGSELDELKEILARKSKHVTKVLARPRLGEVAIGGPVRFADAHELDIPSADLQRQSKIRQKSVSARKMSLEDRATTTSSSHASPMAQKWKKVKKLVTGTVQFKRPPVSAALIGIDYHAMPRGLPMRLHRDCHRDCHRKCHRDYHACPPCGRRRPCRARHTRRGAIMSIHSPSSTRRVSSTAHTISCVPSASWLSRAYSRMQSRTSQSSTFRCNCRSSRARATS